MALHAQLNDLLEHFLPVVQNFHRNGTFAPNAATVAPDGDISGHALTTDGRTQLAAEQGMELLQRPLLEKASSGVIVAVAVFYHSPGIDAAARTVSLPPATHTEDCKALVGLLEHVSGDSVYLLIPYVGSPPDIEYGTGKLIEKPRRYFAGGAAQGKKPWWKVW